MNSIFIHITDLLFPVREAQPGAALTCVVAGYIYPHGWALPLARPPLLRAAGAVEVGQREASALGRQLGEVELGGGSPAPAPGSRSAGGSTPGCPSCRSGRPWSASCCTWCTWSSSGGTRSRAHASPSPRPKSRGGSARTSARRTFWNRHIVNTPHTWTPGCTNTPHTHTHTDTHQHRSGRNAQGHYGSYM